MCSSDLEQQTKYQTDVEKAVERDRLGFTIRLRLKDVLLASTLYHRFSLLACHRRACSNNDTEIVKKLVGDWRPLLDAALNSRNVDLMGQRPSMPVPQTG